MGFFSTEIPATVADVDAARALSEDVKRMTRGGVAVGSVCVLVGYGVFYPGRSLAMFGLALLALAIVIPLMLFLTRNWPPPQLHLDAVRKVRANGRAVRRITPQGFWIILGTVQILALVGVYYLATTPI